VNQFSFCNCKNQKSALPALTSAGCPKVASDENEKPASQDLAPQRSLSFLILCTEFISMLPEL
jgi:hypothetical protein